MRQFNYKTDYDLINTTIKNYIKELYREIILLVEYENREEYIDALEKIQDFKDKYPNLYEVSAKIIEDLTSPYCLQDYYEYNKYSEPTSELGMQFENDLKEIIYLEEKLRNIAVKKWESSQTNFEDIVNGGEFMIVGHSSIRFPGVSFHEEFNKNNINEAQYLSCSMFSHNELNTFQRLKTVYVVDVNDTNFIAASSSDAKTIDTSIPSFQTPKTIEIDGIKHHIRVGYIYDTEKAVTTILTPKLIEILSVSREVKENGEMYNYKMSTTNEIILDRSKVNIKGILLISNGCDLLLVEYLFLKININTFKCINKGIYREKRGLPAYTKEEYEVFIEKLEKIQEYYEKGLIDEKILKSYYEEVVIPMQYNSEVLELINDTFSQYMEIPLGRK